MKEELTSPRTTIDNLENWLGDRELTKTELAQRLEVGRATVTRWFSGEREDMLSQVYTLAVEALEVRMGGEWLPTLAHQGAWALWWRMQATGRYVVRSTSFDARRMPGQTAAIMRLDQLARPELWEVLEATPGVYPTDSIQGVVRWSDGEVTVIHERGIVPDDLCPSQPWIHTTPWGMEQGMELGELWVELGSVALARPGSPYLKSAEDLAKITASRA